MRFLHNSVWQYQKIAAKWRQEINFTIIVEIFGMTPETQINEIEEWLILILKNLWF